LGEGENDPFLGAVIGRRHQRKSQSSRGGKLWLNWN